MTEPTPRASRRLQSHKPPRGMGPAFVLSILAHVLLVLAIAFAVRWNTQPVGPVSVELWGGAPPPPPPRAAEPPRPAPPPPPPAVAPEPERKADIVLEPKKEEPKKEEPKKPPPPDPAIEAKRLADAKAAEEKRVAEAKAEEEKRLAEAKRVAEAKAAEAKRVAEAKAAEAKQAAERHEAELKRITAAAAGSPTGGTPVGAGISSGYRSQIVGCIRPHIVFSVPDGVRAGQHVAEFEVLLAPTGEQLGAPKLLKPSGLAPYDQAVERAIRRCDPFPRPADGPMPRTLSLRFDPVETR